MAAMMLMLIKFLIMTLRVSIKFINVSISAVISWLLPLISQLFSPSLLQATSLFYSLAVFERISLLFVFKQSLLAYFFLPNTS